MRLISNILVEEGIPMADSSYQLPDLQSTVDAQKAGRTTLNSGINTNNANFINSISSKIAGMPTTSQLADTIGGQLGLPQLRQTALQTSQAVFNTPERNLLATRGSDTTQNQLDRVNAYDLSKLQPVASLAAQNQQAAEGTLAQRLGYAQQDFTNSLLPYQYEAPLVAQANDLASAGFNSDNQNELQALIAKMNAGVTLNEGELNRANALAIAKENASNSIQAAQISANRPFAVGGTDTGIYKPGSDSFNLGSWVWKY